MKSRERNYFAAKKHGYKVRVHRFRYIWKFKRKQPTENWGMSIPNGTIPIRELKPEYKYENRNDNYFENLAAKL